ncbi:HDIG domain-containing protein [Sporomusaceae bacterium FL31]|nr:HDIG domain-containing protein [Sporomusaceae bacterium FL31]
MELHILCGIPGSGKSTLLKNLSGTIVSTDAIRKFLWKDESKVKHDKLVFQIADEMIKYMLSIKDNVIFDATNLTLQKRKKYILLAKTYNADITVHWINCPINVAIGRNANRERKVPVPVIISLYKSLQPPDISEGMNRIKIYREDLSLVNEITV